MLTSSFQAEYDRIKELHALPTYVSTEHLLDDLLPGTLFATTVISVLFVVMISVVRIVHNNPKTSSDVTREWAYQLTNMLVNAALGVMGVYYYLYVLEPNPTVDDLVVGYGSSVWPMACLQLGKNLWSLPLGITGVVHETPAKIAHHVAVVLVVLVSSCFTMGFRYFGPFLFGLLELSSVPLAILLIFKENQSLIHQYPKEYTMIRLVFMVSFLYIRWYLYLPFKLCMLRLVAFAVLSFDSKPLIVLGIITWGSMLFIFFLQIYWGCMLLKGFLKYLNKSAGATTGASPTITIKTNKQLK